MESLDVEKNSRSIHYTRWIAIISYLISMAASIAYALFVVLNERNSGEYLPFVVIGICLSTSACLFSLVYACLKKKRSSLMLYAFTGPWCWLVSIGSFYIIVMSMRY